MNDIISDISKGGDLWSRLLNAEKKILVYGMGNGAEKLLDVCEKRGIKISGVFCSDGFERNKTFRGFFVDGSTKTLGKFDDPIILIAFGTHEKSMMGFIYSLAEKYETYAPDLPVYLEGNDIDTEIFDADYYEKNIEKINSARSLFSDENSRDLFDDLIAYKLTGRLDILKKAYTENIPEPFEKDLKICVDAGAYRGDTIEERLKLSPRAEKIFAIEPDEKNQARLEKLFGEDKRVIIVKAAAGEREKREVFLSGNGRGGAVGKSDPRAKRRLVDVLPIDSIVNGEKVDLIKYDVEGAEKNALEGSVKTIRDFMPFLRVSAYHKTADIFELPLYLNEISNGGYDLYLRRKNCIPAWETDIIAVKKTSYKN